MSKKKGLSLDEKRKKMLEIFHESKDVFQMKDIEKLAPAAKGITQQSVKQVLQELVDDGLVESEKIGTSLYYWSFPGKSIKDLKRKVAELEAKSLEADGKMKTMEEALQQAQQNCQDLDIIEEFQQQNAKLKTQKRELEIELDKHKENDPKKIERKAEESKRALEATNRWTDNVFSIKSWCKNKFGMEDKDLDKNFRIPEDFDYLEDS